MIYAQQLLAVLLLALAGRAVSSGAADARPFAAAAHGIAWAVQVSDLHVSKFAHPDIAPDLEVFGARCVGDRGERKSRAAPQQWHHHRRPRSRVQL